MTNYYLVRSNENPELKLIQGSQGEVTYSKRGMKIKDMEMASELAKKHNGTVVLVEPELEFE